MPSLTNSPTQLPPPPVDLSNADPESLHAADSPMTSTLTPINPSTRKNSSPASNSDSASIGVMSIASASDASSDESDDEDSASEENGEKVDGSDTAKQPSHDAGPAAISTRPEAAAHPLNPSQASRHEKTSPPPPSQENLPGVPQENSPPTTTTQAAAPPANEEEMDEFLKHQILQYQNTVEQLQEQILSLRNTKKYDLPQRRANIQTKHGLVEIYTPSRQELKFLYKMWKDQNNYHHHLDPIFYRPFMKHTLSVLKEYMSEESTVTLKVARLNGVVSGFITYLITQENYYDTNIRRYGAIVELHVTRDVRGKGIGKYLLDYAENVFTLYGLQYSKIQMSTFNKKAIRFYSHLGYVGRQLFMYKRIGVNGNPDNGQTPPRPPALQSKM
mmetsp:Transcript_11383/g.42735  ORF Transcript_11383/g.42735 Transcript_11383/m.42735 type:complete len:388 (+) Transcript_11383:365-1528(+)|eukprot:CAMPEP_0117445470 /NCGR_PEP_ID=MMETSP0759-20121206/5813_1 /TAXON_ID=63605 /ORGANISM="Percolomonas cosmopolitus, Strain WS" /LENGTH=387 /DNA_ID=CAMNT_0005237649 /DNA_START=311 /DNA_END=1474 /DNA_ORIENTATION=+